ncbi:50S ribosomal protein L3 [Verruconis gallopava]|uniref:Large ribosomal subunit protein uL3m n=1 Tax=Verruconis gallopava TaxID=253628 RepID=A0A0D1YET3_9PEZI|nr:50S ribosomal protein L3 [Verruconis gallopava]KIV99246.1 50S ribosomal protein L3 [Verruconis gallopava]
MPPRPPINILLSALYLQLPAPLRTLPCQAQRRGIRSILKPPPKPNRFDQSAHHGAPEALSRSKVLERKSYTIPQRTGLLAIKKGHVSIYEPDTGRRMPATVLQVDRCQVISYKTLDKHGYWAVQVGSGYRKPKNMTRPELGHLANYKISPKDKIVEFRVKDSKGLQVPIGSELKPDWFTVGQYVDCRSKNKGKGFAGVMKKHGMSGQPASHGQSLTHRTLGSAGGSQGSGSRVHPGKRMAGRMGGIMHTVQNLKVLMTDSEKGILVVKGLVSGPKNSYVRVQDSKKMPDQVNKLGLKMGAELEVQPAKVLTSTGEASPEAGLVAEQLMATEALDSGAAPEARL